MHYKKKGVFVVVVVAKIIEKYATRSFLDFWYFCRKLQVIHSALIEHLLRTGTVFEAVDRKMNDRAWATEAFAV